MNNSLKKIRSYRINQFAIFDFAISFIFALIVSKIFGLNVVSSLTLIIPFAVVIHELFNIRTPLNNLIIRSDDKASKLIMVFLIIVGIYSIRKQYF